MDHHDNQPRENENIEGNVVHSETFVFTGTGGPALLAAMRTLMTSLMRGQQAQDVQQGQQGHPEQQAQPEEHPQQEQAQPEQQSQPGEQRQPEQQAQPEQLRSVDEYMTDDPPVPNIPAHSGDDNHDDHDMPSLEPLDAPSETRPIRPLPRPHAHIHAHTPAGIIELFTFNVTEPPPPPPPGAATFTFNLGLGPDVLAGFEAFFLGGMQKECEPDPERAKVLIKGMTVVPQGLVRRLERADGVPGSQGTETNAGCAVCWGPLLDAIEPGEWDTAKEKEDRKMSADDNKEQTPTDDDDDLRGRIVALPCAHVYHAECLLPWFSRNTTCPTCRFDIDPDSLTWTPRPPPEETLPPPPPPPPANGPPPPDSFNTPPPPHAPNGDPNPHPEQHGAHNAADAARLNAFVTSIIRATARLIPGNPPPSNQSPPTSQANPQPQSQFQSPPQPQPPQPQPQLPHPTEPLVFGPAAPPPPPPPTNHNVFPQFFRIPVPGPFIIVPTNAAHPNPAGTNPPPPFPPFNFTDRLPQPPPGAVPPNAPHPPHQPQIFPFGFHPPHPAPQQPPRERKKWVPPEPVGKTFRQRVEQKERELGLRCDDMVCGVAPSDEDPVPAAGAETKRIRLRAAYDAHGKACEHEFHPACLVTSARVTGVTEDENKDGDGEDDEMQVACPVCRSEGSLNRAEWDEGVRALEAEMA